MNLPWTLFVALTSSPFVALAQIPSTKESSELFRVTEEFSQAVSAKDPKRAASLYTENAYLMPPNMTSIRGRSNIESVLNQLIQQHLSVSYYSIGSSSSENIGYDVGTYELSLGEGASQLNDKGKYMAILHREKDGKWRMEYDIWNSDLSPGAK